MQHLRQRDSFMTVRHQQHINRMTIPSHSVRRHQYITRHGNHVFRRPQPLTALLDNGLSVKILQMPLKKSSFVLSNITPHSRIFKPYIHSRYPINCFMRSFLLSDRKIQCNRRIYATDFNIKTQAYVNFTPFTLTATSSNSTIG